MTEMMVVTDDYTVWLKFFDQEITNVFRSRQLGELTGKGGDHYMVYAGFDNEIEFLLQGGDELYRLPGEEQLARVRLEGDDNALAFHRFSVPYHFIEYGTVTKVHTVEGAYGKHRMLETW